MSPEIPKVLKVRARIKFASFCLDVDENFELAGITGLFGPSGGGKSTFLRVVAGLADNPGGEVSFDGVSWQRAGIFVPAHRRPVGYVFQDVRLFAHLSVSGNLQFASRRMRPGERSVSYADVVAALDLEKLLSRHVAGLSGGERQRVAIARTLLSNPRLLLLDEPLAALDSRRKRDIYPTLAALPVQFGIPVIFVSHAVDEMARLADHVVVLDGGKIVAQASAEKVLNRDELRHTAMPFEAISILTVVVTEHLQDLQLVRVDHRGQTLTIPAGTTTKIGATLRLVVRSGDIVIATEKPVGLSVRNVLAGSIESVDTDADDAFAVVSVDVDRVSIKAQLTKQAVQELQLAPGRSVFVLLKTASFARED